MPPGAPTRSPPSTFDEPARRRSWSLAPELPLIFAVAVAVRYLAVAMSPGGFGGYTGYDAGVYYAAGDALIHGRMPYADFVLLHPPSLMLAVTPFAALGAVTSDHAGFMIANAAFIVLAGVNAMLVIVVARRFGLARPPAILGGLAYAFWYTTVIAETSVRLEPLANLLTLLGLLALTADRRKPRPLLLAVAGFAFGAAASTKITWLAPLAVVLIWYFVLDRSARRFGALLAGTVASFVLIDGPFLLAAPHSMASMVLIEQLRRPRGSGLLVSKMYPFSGIVTSTAPSVPIQLVLAGAIVVFVLVTSALAWTRPAARLPAVLALVQVAVLIASPRWAFYYGDFAAVPVCLTTAAAATVLLRRSLASRRTVRAGVAAAIVVPLVVVTVSTLAWLARGPAITSPFPNHRLRAAAAKVRCVIADAPIALIELNALSDGLSRGCPNWVDVTGRTYGIDRPKVIHGHHQPRTLNAKWQRDLRRYLTSGDAVILVRPQTGVSAATRAAVTAGARLATDGRHTLHATP
ncbi:MAG: hypothetical protein ACR2LX_04740 [Jatrophihabitans sp.]